MRNRFFLTTLFVLIAVSIGTISIHAYFLKAERLDLIDQQVRETAAALVDSELNDLRKIDFEAADDIISDELGESRIGKFFVIRNAKSEIIYQSSSAQLLSAEDIPQTPQWIQINRNGKFIRVLNLQLPRVNDRSLQVGVLVDGNLIESDYFSFSTLLVFITILSIGLLVSWLVSFFLMRPITKLETFLSGSAKEQTSFLPSLPTDFSKGATHDSRDEFKRLLFELNELIDKINRNYRSSRLWSYQMAHELKTPLTFLHLQVEKIFNSTQNTNAHEVLNEITRMNEIIQSFLSWAELENTPKQKHLFAIRLGKIVEDQVSRLSTLYPSRLIVKGHSSLTVIANPQHLEQAIHNILINALEYSPESDPVIIELSQNQLKVTDLGSGISEDVLSRIGEPFNQGTRPSGARKQSHGLGLAWVKTITRLYNWRLEIYSTPKGSTVSIRFEEPAYRNTSVKDETLTPT